MAEMASGRPARADESEQAAVSCLFPLSFGVWLLLLVLRSGHEWLAWWGRGIGRLQG